MTTIRHYTIDVPGKDLCDNAYDTVAAAADRASWHDAAELCVWVPEIPGDPRSGVWRQVPATAQERREFHQLSGRGSPPPHHRKSLHGKRDRGE